MNAVTKIPPAQSGWNWETAVATADRAAAPQTARLLEGLQNTLASFAGSLDARGAHSLQGAMVVVNELMLRQDRGFFARIYAGFREIATEAHAAGGASESALAALPTDLDDRTAYDVIAHAIEAATVLIDRAIHALLASAPETARDIEARALALEAEFHAHRTEQMRPAISAVTDVSIPTADVLQRYLDDRFPEKGLQVRAFRELVGGYQKKTILFEAEDRDGTTEGYVIRAEKEKPFLILDAGKVGNEFDLVKLLHDAGLPVAEPLWVEADPALLGTRFMVSRRLPGESMGSAIATGKLTESTARELVQILARIHRLPIDARLRKSVIGVWTTYPTLAANTRANVEKWRRQPYMDCGETSIALARVYDWLLANVPEEEAPARFLHVDYGPHNVLVDGDHVSGIVDWEAARIGDPAEDLGYMMQNFQGQFDREQVLQWYRDAGGDDISEYRLRYFDVFSSLKMLVGPISAAGFYQTNRDAAIDWCVMALLYGRINRAVEAPIAAAEAARAAR